MVDNPIWVKRECVDCAQLSSFYKFEDLVWTGSILPSQQHLAQLGDSLFSNGIELTDLSVASFASPGIAVGHPEVV